jgi:hypothetical protein
VSRARRSVRMCRLTACAVPRMCAADCAFATHGSAVAACAAANATAASELAARPAVTALAALAALASTGTSIVRRVRLRLTASHVARCAGSVPDAPPRYNRGQL